MLSDYDKQWCSKLLADLGKMPISSPFRNPVNSLAIPDYLTIIKRPMDFSTMKKKLQNGEYSSVRSFIDDIQLICDNAKTFNGEQSLLGIIGNDIMDEVNKQYSEKPSNSEEEWYKSLNKAILRLQEHMNSPPSNIVPSESQIEMPKISVSDLSNSQIQQIEQMVGGESINELGKKWNFLNNDTKKEILNILGETE